MSLLFVCVDKLLFRCLIADSLDPIGKRTILLFSSSLPLFFLRFGVALQTNSYVFVHTRQYDQVLKMAQSELTQQLVTVINCRNNAASSGRDATKYNFREKSRSSSPVVVLPDTTRAFFDSTRQKQAEASRSKQKQTESEVRK